VLDAHVEADHAELGELLGEGGGDAVGPGLADHGDLAHAVGVERLADAADPLDGEPLPGKYEIVVVEAEDALAPRGVEQEGHLRGDVRGAPEAHGAAAPGLDGVVVEGDDGAVAALAPAAPAADDRDERDAHVMVVRAVAPGEGHAVEIVEEAA